MVARGDAVLIGLVGFMALYVGVSVVVSSSFRPSFLGLLVLFLGVGLFTCAAILYARAPPSPWSPHASGLQPLVSLACPVYGTPLAWVDEVARWYCPRCQAYHGAGTTLISIPERPS